MRKNYLTLAIVALFTISGSGQSYYFVNQLIIANGGVYSNPDDFVTVASYNPNSEVYEVFDEIKTQSVQFALTDQNSVFIAAQDSLVKYNLDTYERVAAIELEALKNLAVYEDKLIVTRQFPASENFIYILNKQDLSLNNVLNPSGEASGIAVLGDTAYVAIPGDWGNAEGKLAVVDLVEESIVKEINFGVAGKGMKDVMQKDATIYTVNSHFFDYTNNVYSMSKYETTTGDTSTTMFFGDYYGFYGSSVMTDTTILFPLSMDIAQYSLENENIESYTMMNPSAIVYDSITNQIYITESNYTDWGKLHVFNRSGEEIGEALEIGVAPEALAIDYRQSDINVRESQMAHMTSVVNFYPNPADDHICFSPQFYGEITSVELFEGSGKLMFSKQGSLKKLVLNTIPSGFYILRIRTHNQVIIERIIIK